MSPQFEPVVFRPLPRPVKPFPEETESSFLNRLATANALPVQRLRQPSRWLTSRLDSIDQLSVLSGQPRATIEYAIPRWKMQQWNVSQGPLAATPRWGCRRCVARRTGKPQQDVMVPRDEISTRVGALLDEDPAATLATVQERVGLSYAAAARALPRLRGERIADLLQAEPELTPEDAATRLGYPTAVQRTALASAATELRARQVQPYLQRVADVLVGAGVAEQQDVTVQRLEGDVLAAAVVLSGSGVVPALVWDERYGWRTAVSRRHPIGKDTGTPPEHDGIRYLSEAQQPEPAELLTALTDGRRGFRQPTALHPVGTVLHG